MKRTTKPRRKEATRQHRGVNGTLSSSAPLKPRKPPNGSLSIPFAELEDDEEGDEKESEDEHNEEEVREPAGQIARSDKERPKDEFVGSMYQHDHGAEQRCILVLLWAIPLINSMAELMVLSQFIYWFSLSRDGKLRAKIKKDNYYWIFKTHRELATETNLTRDQVIRAVRNLKKAGILISVDAADEGHRVYYRLDPIVIEKMVETNERRKEKAELAKQRRSRKLQAKKVIPKKRHCAPDEGID